jgi:membrane protein DedA with SNARE-associated domain
MSAAIDLFAASWLSDAVHRVGDVFASHGYIIIAALVGGESAGLPLPGETSLLAGAVAAEHGLLNIILVILVAAGAAVVGDNIGYIAGRRMGRPFLERHGRLLRVNATRLAAIDHSFHRHGPLMVFFGRWILLLRATAGPLAGASRMPWPRFLVYNALGAISWATTMGLLGYFFSKSVSAIESAVGVIGVVLLAVVVVGAVVLVRRAERRLLAESAPSTTEPADTGPDDESA